LRRLEGIEWSVEVTGPYDVIARAEDNEALQTVSDLDGILRIHTALPA
jgi:hypothetical protein